MNNNTQPEGSALEQITVGGYLVIKGSLEHYARAKSLEMTERLSNGDVTLNLANLKEWFNSAILSGEKYAIEQQSQERTELLEANEKLLFAFNEVATQRNELIEVLRNIEKRSKLVSYGTKKGCQDTIKEVYQIAQQVLTKFNQK